MKTDPKHRSGDQTMKNFNSATVSLKCEISSLNYQKLQGKLVPGPPRQPKLLQHLFIFYLLKPYLVKAISGYLENPGIS